jgi:hypothetical protein
VASDVPGSLVLGVQLGGAPELHLQDEERGDVLAGPEGVDQRNEFDFLIVLPALVADALLPWRATDVAAGPANGAACAIDALLAQAARVAADAFQRAATVRYAPRCVRAALGAAHTILRAARCPEAPRVFIATDFATLPCTRAAGPILAGLAGVAAHITADLGCRAAALRKACLVARAARSVAESILDTADSVMTRFVAETACVAANQGMWAAGFVVQALLVILAAGQATCPTGRTTAVWQAGCAISAAGIAAGGVAGAATLCGADVSGVAALAETLQCLRTARGPDADVLGWAALVVADCLV